MKIDHITQLVLMGLLVWGVWIIQDLRSNLISQRNAYIHCFDGWIISPDTNDKTWTKCRGTGPDRECVKSDGICDEY